MTPVTTRAVLPPTERHSLTNPESKSIQAATACEAFQAIVKQYPEKVALQSIDRSFQLTWRQLNERIRTIAGGLRAIGVHRGDSVAFLATNLPENHMLDYATAHLGALAFGIFTTSSAEQIRHQLRSSGARVVVTQRDLLPSLLAAIPSLDDQVSHIIVIDDVEACDDRILTLADLEASCAEDFPFDEVWGAVQPTDLLTIIFTSGTTGPPKGVEYTHGRVMAQLRALHAGIPVSVENLVSFLPLAHMGGRMSVHYLALIHGASITACPEMRQAADALKASSPDTMMAVPRVFEKFQASILAAVAAMPDEAARDLVGKGLESGMMLAKSQERGKDIDAALAHRLESARDAARVVLGPILDDHGLGKLVSAYTGGAPCSPELTYFFRAAGVPLLESYGSSETALSIFNRVDNFKCSTAGQALPGVEMKLGPDGELLVRSPFNMEGYRNLPEETAAAFDGDGWFGTGDIAQIDDEGFITFIDRKKEVLINSAGKTMSPLTIEAAIKDESSLIGFVVAIGDRRGYNTALISLNAETLAGYAAEFQLDPTDIQGWARDECVRDSIQAAVNRGNARLSRPEQIKKFTVLPLLWGPGSEELTLTLKMKRKVIYEKYAHEIESMYAR
ncbi:AMP-dependent synthetase/ligase [Specibacter sp. RAF43]|uniref:AMP-dependent synthetase/ligase n=1 Tax=Specibacter sp. RAF43 TaxID=3233057 RepID=UPI003F99282E